MTTTKLHAKDVNAGYFRAYLVQPCTVTRKPSRRVRRMLSRKRTLATIGAGLKTAVKGVYAASVLFALIGTASLLEAGSIGALNLGRIVAGMIWVAVPVAIKIGGALHDNH